MFSVLKCGHPLWLSLLFSVTLGIWPDGKYGCGKAATLCHVAHYASLNNWLIISKDWGKLMLFFLRNEEDSCCNLEDSCCNFFCLSTRMCDEKMKASESYSSHWFPL